MEFAETIAQHHRRIGRPGMGRSVISQMRRVLALRSQGLNDVSTIQQQSRASWWIADLSIEDLLGWLEIDQTGQPLVTVDDLSWHAPPEAGCGWSLTYDEVFAHGDSYKVLAHRDRTPPSSSKGVVKLDGDAIVSEYAFYQLAHWLGLPAAPVQIIEVPPDIPTRWEWSQQVDKIDRGSMDASELEIIEMIDLMNAEVRNRPRAGALIWWIESTADEGLWSDWDDPRTAGLIALAAAAESVESHEFHRTADGIPFLVDNQYAFRELREPRSTASTSATEWWAERIKAAPKTAQNVVRATWQRLADLDIMGCMQIMGMVPIKDMYGNAVCSGWPVTRQRARDLIQATGIG